MRGCIGLGIRGGEWRLAMGEVARLKFPDSSDADG